MTVEFRTGDLFAQGFPALAHGVNLRGVMGAGIAKEFRRRWPGMYEPYRRWCRAGVLQLGDALPYGDNPVIYNLVTQDRPGPHADRSAIGKAVRVMLGDAQDRGITEVGLPRIGAGIGGLAWADVRATIESVAAASPIRIVVVTLPGELGS